MDQEWLAQVRRGGAPLNAEMKLYGITGQLRFFCHAFLVTLRRNLNPLASSFVCA